MTPYLYSAMTAIGRFMIVMGNPVEIIHPGRGEIVLNIFPKIALIALESKNVVRSLRSNLSRNTFLTTGSINGHNAAFDLQGTQQLGYCSQP